MVKYPVQHGLEVVLFHGVVLHQDAASLDDEDQVWESETIANEHFSSAVPCCPSLLG